MCHWQRFSNVHSNICSLSVNSEVEGNISSSMPTMVMSFPCSTPTTNLALSHRFLRILLYPDIKQVRRRKVMEGWLEGCISWVQGSLGLVLETSSQLPQFISRLLNIMSLCPTTHPFSFLLPAAPLLFFSLHKDLHTTLPISPPLGLCLLPISMEPIHYLRHVLISARIFALIFPRLIFLHD